MPYLSDPTKPLYYAEGRTIFKQPLCTRQADGSTTVTIGFPVCVASEYVEPDQLAAVLSHGDTVKLDPAPSAD